MARPRVYKSGKLRKLIKTAAISDDEQSDVDGDVIGNFAIPLEKRPKSRSVEYREDVADAKSEDDIPKVKGDLNGDAAKPVESAEPDQDEEEDDDEDLDADEYILRGQ